ncbi:MAG: ARPP-1 family domain-containing protein [Hyphomonas sp.]
MHAIQTYIASLHPGAPVQAGRLTMAALMAEGPFSETAYMLLDEAIAAGQLELSEVSEAGIVAHLLATNHSDKPVLLFDGEELKGAKQNRIVNATILVPPGAMLTLPVSCVEQGRWRYEAAGFAPSGEALFAKARLRKAERMASARRMKERRQANASWSPDAFEDAPSPDMFLHQSVRLSDFDADQNAVWNDVQEALRQTGTHSPSSAMHDSYVLRRAEIERLSTAFTPQQGQVGAVFCIDGRPVGIELTDSPRAFGAIFGKLVRSYCLNALGEAPPFAKPGPEAVKAFIAAVTGLDQMVSPSVGIGEDVRLDGASACGSALIANKHLVHLSAFSKAAFEPA